MKNFLRKKSSIEAKSWASQIDEINKCLSIPGLTRSESSSVTVFTKFSYYIRFLIIFSWPVFSFYSVINASNSSDYFESILITIAGIHVIIKFVFLWLLKEKRKELLERIVHTTTSNEEINQDYIILSSKIMVGTINIWVISASVYMLGPLLKYKDWKLPVKMSIIGISTRSHPGYEINYIFQLIQYYFGVYTCIGFDLVFFVCCIFTVSRFDLCKRYSAFIGDKTGQYNTEDKQKEMLHSLIDIHMDAIEFLDEFKALSQNYGLGHILTAMTLSSLNIVQMFTGNQFYISFIMVMVALFELLIYSILGEIIASKSEELVNGIYCSNWYELKDIENRKMVHLILLNAQHCKGFLIKGFFNLSLERFAEILKACYAFIVFLKNIL